MCKKRQKHPFFHTFIKVWIWPGLPPSPRVEKIHIFYFFLKASLIVELTPLSFHTFLLFKYPIRVKLTQNILREILDISLDY